jgi:hypothetical protein
MAYRVYSGPRGSQSISPLEKDRHLYKEFGVLDEAMGWARHINDGGRVALLIEGDDGTRLTKQQIVAALKNPEAGGSKDHAAWAAPRDRVFRATAPGRHTRRAGGTD